MLEDFIFSDDGEDLLAPFYDMFDCSIGIEEPDGDELFMEVDGKAYLIPSNESVEDFCSAVRSSLIEGKNLLVERYKNHPTSYIAGVDY